MCKVIPFQKMMERRIQGWLLAAENYRDGWCDVWERQIKKCKEGKDKDGVVHYPNSN